MNSAVRAKMFTTPLTVFEVGNKDSSGDRTIVSSLGLFGYITKEVKTVVNDLGAEEISTFQIYLAEDDIGKVKKKNEITCLEKIHSKIIKMQTFYLGGSALGLGVLYLP